MNLRTLIALGESETLDFKKSITNLHKIAKHIAAFANHKGGQLLIGLDDDGSIKGIKSEDEERFMISKSCNQFIKPAIEPHFEEIEIDQKLILIVTIPESECKPHYALDKHDQWCVYIRMDDKSILVNPII